MTNDFETFMNKLESSRKYLDFAVAVAEDTNNKHKELKIISLLGEEKIIFTTNCEFIVSSLLGKDVRECIDDLFLTMPIKNLCLRDLMELKKIIQKIILNSYSANVRRLERINVINDKIIDALAENVLG